MGVVWGQARPPLRRWSLERGLERRGRGLRARLQSRQKAGPHQLRGPGWAMGFLLDLWAGRGWCSQPAVVAPGQRVPKEPIAIIRSRSQQREVCCILSVVAPQVLSRLRRGNRSASRGRSASITLKKSMGSGITGAPVFRKHSLPGAVFHLLP